MLLTALVFLAVLSVLVLVHELGHFLVAKKLGIRVEELGFGLPPRVFGIKRGETIYSVNLLPIGGFVRLYGEDEVGNGKSVVRSKKLEVKRAFYSRPVWQRGAVVVAGVLMNLILAIVVISYLFTQGVPIPTGEVEIKEVQPESPAAVVGIKRGDIILRVDETKMTRINEVQRQISPKIEEEVKVVIKRDGNIKEFVVKTKKETIDSRIVGIIGVALSDSEIKKYPIFQAPFAGTIEAIRFSWLIISGLTIMLWNWLMLGQVPQDVAGPFGIAQITGQAVRFGTMAVLSLTALLSLNLAVLNILPIPALDGGRLLFILIEIFTRRRVNPHFERYAHTIGMIILLALIALVTLRDISRVISGKLPFGL